jgi:hypothetical protein
MLLAAMAWRLRQSARQALASGQFDLAARLAAQAQAAHQTRAADSLSDGAAGIAPDRLLPPPPLRPARRY